MRTSDLLSIFGSPRFFFFGIKEDRKYVRFYNKNRNGKIVYHEWEKDYSRNYSSAE